MRAPELASVGVSAIVGFIPALALMSDAQLQALVGVVCALIAAMTQYLMVVTAERRERARRGKLAGKRRRKDDHHAE